MHNCQICKHELEYCEHCDIVYCKKCSKEWKTKSIEYVYPWSGGGSGTTNICLTNCTDAQRT